jgi:hypothetical protein
MSRDNVGMLTKVAHYLTPHYYTLLLWSTTSSTYTIMHIVINSTANYTYARVINSATGATNVTTVMP